MKPEKRIALRRRLGLCAESTWRRPHRGRMDGVLGVASKENDRTETTRFLLCTKHAQEIVRWASKIDGAEIHVETEGVQ